jgi:lysyl-tRNA synthetase class 2
MEQDAETHVAVGEDGEVLSKSEQKRREKARRKAELKASKEAATAAVPSASAKAPPAVASATVDTSEMSATDYRQYRLSTVRHLEESGVNPYPHKFHRDLSLPEFRARFDALEAGQNHEGAHVSVAGRVMNVRAVSPKLSFLDLHGDGAKLQVMLNYQYFDPDHKDQVRAARATAAIEQVRTWAAVPSRTA